MAVDDLVAVGLRQVAALRQFLEAPRPGAIKRRRRHLAASSGDCIVAS
jgi:hypothetical protein